MINKTIVKHPEFDWVITFDTRVADRLKRNGAVYVSFWGIKSFNG